MTHDIPRKARHVGVPTVPLSMSDTSNISDTLTTRADFRRRIWDL
jgi:hypothetical protein